MPELSNKNKKTIIIILYAMISVLLWQFELGRLIFYPFTVLGTWFHEMGHGLMALLLGGSFHKLEIYSNGSGEALTSGGYFLGSIGNGLVALAGPIGPTIAGAAFIISSKTEKASKTALSILTVLLIGSSLYWVRNWFGTPVILFFGLISLFALLKGSVKFQQNLILFLGIQACISVYMSISYLMMKQFPRNGEQLMSDTGNMELYLLLPHWLWGGIIVFISIFAIWKSLKHVIK